MRKYLVLGLGLFAASAAHAWQCPSGQIRQQAPAGTPTTAPYYDVVEGIAFICVPTPGAAPAPKPAPTPAPVASSPAAPTATHVMAQVITGSSPMSQSQTQTQSAAASNNGDNSNNYNSTYVNPKQVATAIAPDILPTVPCFKGYGAAAQTTAFGLSMGGGKVDKGCEARETARYFTQIGNRTAAAKILCSQDAAKKAGLTLADCLAFLPPPTVSLPAPIVQPTPQIVVNVPPAVVTQVAAPVLPVPAVIVKKPVVPVVHHVRKPVICTPLTAINKQDAHQ